MNGTYLLKEINNKDNRNSFIIKNFKIYSFLNSREWGEFQKLEGNKIYRLGIFDKDNIQIGLIFLIKIIAKRGSILLCPHSPLINKDNYFEIMRSIFDQIKKIGEEENVSCIRVCPIVENNTRNLRKFEDLGFKFSPLHMHAEETHLLDLVKSEDELLQDMRKTTRYIIKRAQKEGVIIKQDNSDNNINHFIHMHIKHSRRDNGKLNYNPFSKSYINKLFKVFDKSQITLINAEYQNYVEASLVSIRFGENCVYYLGASDIKHPKFSPAYLLQREAIKHAKQQGCKIYNFWGVSPDNNPKHPLFGVSLFKRGFGGYDYNMLHTQDYPLSWKYWIIYGIEKLRASKRGYYYNKPL